MQEVESLLGIGSGNKESSNIVLELPKMEVTLFEASSEDRIVDFEVFKHYLAIMHEKN